MSDQNEQNLEMLAMEQLTRAADCLRVMAHPVRLRMVEVLMQGDFMVAQLAELCGVAPHQACEHLRLMKGCGLLGAERRGREVYYKIQSQQLPSLLRCIRQHCDAAEDNGNGIKKGSSAKKPGKRSAS